MNKVALRQAILDQLRQEFESSQASSRRTRAQGNDAESKAEGKYDTRSIEENYLADGLARQAQATAQAAAAYESLPLPDYDADTPIDLAALVKLDLPDESAWFFLGPSGGGIEVTVENTSVTVITPESPLGQQLLDRKQGEATTSPRAVIREVR